MEMDPSSKKPRSLTEEIFGGFLLWLSPDREQAARKYLDLRVKLIKLFVHRGSAHAEELAEETLDRAAIIFYEEPTKYANPIALCCGIAKYVWHEDQRKIVPEPLKDDNFSPPPQIKNNVDFNEHEEKCLGSCLEELSPRERDLITQYHQFQGGQKIEARKRLAQTHGGLNKLRITTYRIRVKLHNCINSCVRRSAMN